MFPCNFLLFRISFLPTFFNHFYVIFINILKKVYFSDFRPLPTCDVPSCETCDGYKDCDDNSDEIGCQCPANSFECPCYQSVDGCAGRWGCIRQSWVCDGKNSCGDWSDEKYCLNTKFYCTNHECVERSKVNDGKVDMTSGYDEFTCNATQGHKCGCKRWLHYKPQWRAMQSN